MSLIMMDDHFERLTRDLSDIEAVRLRPGMYVGSTDFFGFINYLVCPVALLLSQRPSRIAVTPAEGKFEIESDVAIPIEETSNGRLTPFEHVASFGQGLGFEGTVLNALSERLMVEVRNEGLSESLDYRRGIRESRRTTDHDSRIPNTRLTFQPDGSIFKVTDVSPAVFKSYLRRLSFLHRGVRFSISFGEETEEYYAENGIVDLFASVSAPYQILHEPIHIVGEDGALQLEAVFAFHSWTEHGLWNFINNGRAVEGGTHVKGLNDALDKIYRKFIRRKMPKARRNGVVGVLSIRYPDAVWEGCIKARIGNPELRAMVCDLVVSTTSKWLENRPDVIRQLQDMEIFQFPEQWSV